MTVQTKHIVFYICVLIMVTPHGLAQNQSINKEQAAYKTMHIFNLKPKYTVDDIQSVLRKFNKLFIKLGHPECRYTLWESSEKKQPRYLWESTWSSKRVYDEIHKNKEYRKLIREDAIGLRIMFKDHTDYKYYERSL